MERVTRPQEFKTKVATNTKHAIKTTTITTTTTTNNSVDYHHIDIKCRLPLGIPNPLCVAKRMTGNRM